MIESRGLRVTALIALIPLAAACEPPPEPVGGAALFAHHCARCHGSAGDGTGPLAAELPVRPANLRTIAARNGGNFDDAAVMAAIDGRRSVAAHGSREMPVWGEVFESEFAADGAPRPRNTALLRSRLLTDYVMTLQD